MDKLSTFARLQKRTQLSIFVCLQVSLASYQISQATLMASNFTMLSLAKTIRAAKNLTAHTLLFMRSRKLLQTIGRWQSMMSNLKMVSSTDLTQLYIWLIACGLAQTSRRKFRWNSGRRKSSTMISSVRLKATPNKYLKTAFQWPKASKVTHGKKC